MKLRLYKALDRKDRTLMNVYADNPRAAFDTAAAALDASPDLEKRWIKADMPILDVDAKIAYDHFEIYLEDYAADDPEERRDIAILNAREDAYLYVIPCNWMTLEDDGTTLLVRRARHYHQPMIKHTR